MTRAGRAAFLPVLFSLACAADTPLGPASNRAPQVRSVTITPPVVPVGGTAEVRVDAMDPDGDTLFFRYQAEAGTITPDPADASRASYRNDGVPRAADRITVTVLDNSTAMTVAEAAVSLQSNRAPTVRVTGPRACHPACTLSLEAHAEDPDGDPITYAWSGCASGTASTGQCALSAPGQFTAEVTVQDNRGGSSRLSVGVTGTNAAPIVTGGQILRGVTQARFLVDVQEADNDPLICGWFGDCNCTGSVQSFNLMCQLPAGPASCFMRFACTDPFGASGETRFEMHR
jgi:hypothetical protein